MFSFCLDHGLFGFIFLSVSSACSVFVSILSLRPNGYPRPLLANANRRAHPHRMSRRILCGWECVVLSL